MFIDIYIQQTNLQSGQEGKNYKQAKKKKKKNPYKNNDITKQEIVRNDNKPIYNVFMV